MIDPSHPLWKGRLSERVADTSAGAATETVESTAVPTGELWVVESILAYNASSTVTRISLNAHDGTTAMMLDLAASPTAYTPCKYHGELVLQAADKIQAVYVGNTNLDLLRFYIWGYKLYV